MPMRSENPSNDICLEIFYVFIFLFLLKTMRLLKFQFSRRASRLNFVIRTFLRRQTNGIWWLDAIIPRKIPVVAKRKNYFDQRKSERNTPTEFVTSSVLKIFIVWLFPFSSATLICRRFQRYAFRYGIMFFFFVYYSS